MCSDPATVAKDALDELITQRDQALEKSVKLEAELNKLKQRLSDVYSAYLALREKYHG